VLPNVLPRGGSQDGARNTILRITLPGYTPSEFTEKGKAREALSGVCASPRGRSRQRLGLGAQPFACIRFKIRTRKRGKGLGMPSDALRCGNPRERIVAISDK
jgi:hypothetical protein